jgi:hypothetical protein
LLKGLQCHPQTLHRRKSRGFLFKREAEILVLESGFANPPSEIRIKSWSMMFKTSCRLL